MITINDQLKVTKQVNQITRSFVTRVLKRDLLYLFCFDTKAPCSHDEKTITYRLETAWYYQGDITPELLLELQSFIYNYFKMLNEDEKMAWYYYTVNENYLNYTDEFEASNFEMNYTIEETNFQFGRNLAYKLNFPDYSFINEVYSTIQSILLSFSCELDLSLINSYTSETILETIDIHTC